jgi:hypothetical protein
VSLQRDMENLRIAWQDLGYAVAKELRLLRLTKRLGMTERGWVKQARWRAEGKDSSQEREPS